MIRLTIKNLWAHKVRLALTSVAVVLGVAFMAATMVLTDTMGRTFDDMFAVGNAGTDVVVQQPRTVDAEWGEVRERVPATILETTRAVPGVARAAGVVEGFAQIVRADGTVGTLDGLGATIGSNWIDDPELNPFRLDRGRAPTTDGEVVVDRATAEDNGWALGDEITVIAKGEPVPLTLVGTATYGELSGMPGSALVAVTDPVAQRLFAEPGTYDVVLVGAADGVDADTLSSRIDAALGTGTYEVRTGAEDTAAQQARFRDDLSFFQTFLMAFACVALLVGTFLISNTFSILAAQRTREVAMLRAIGASRHQILGSSVLEAAAIGLLAGAGGLAAGIAMSSLLRGLLGAVGLEIPSGPAVISTGTVVTSFVVGFTVTVVSALAPAVRASRVKPIAALRDVAVDRSGVSPGRAVAGLALVGGGLAAFAAGVAGVTDAALGLLAAGTLGTFVGVFVLGPVIAGPVTRVLGWPIATATRVTGSLARENAGRSPKRTAATAAALTVGVALVGFITILAASTKASVADGVARSFRADYIVDSGAFTEGGFGPDLADELRSLPAVAQVAPTRMAAAALDGAPTRVTGTDTATIGELYEFETVDGAIADVGAGEVAVSRAVAEEHGWDVGSPVTVTFSRTGDVELTVAAVFDGLGSSDSPFLVDLSTYEANVTDQYDQTIYLATADGIGADASRRAIEEVLAPHANAHLEDQAGFEARITSDIDRMLNLIYGLLLLAVVIALIGITNTLALSIHERRRELGLLRAVGMTRGQVRATVRWESVLIALLGTTLGAVLAVAGAWGIVQALADQSITTFAVPAAQLAVIVALAAAAGVAAALGPARRAARQDVLAAIAS